MRRVDTKLTISDDNSIATSGGNTISTSTSPSISLSLSLSPPFTSRFLSFGALDELLLEPYTTIRYRLNIGIEINSPQNFITVIGTSFNIMLSILLTKKELKL